VLLLWIYTSSSKKLIRFSLPRGSIYAHARTKVAHRVATKLSRNEIPRYFVLFLFRIFAKILGKIPRNFAEFRFAKMFSFRHISRNSVDLVQII
jgi:hypothetical protein